MWVINYYEYFLRISLFNATLFWVLIPDLRLLIAFGFCFAFAIYNYLFINSLSELIYPTFNIIISKIDK
jgi:hypothetical protein